MNPVGRELGVNPPAFGELLGFEFSAAFPDTRFEGYSIFDLLYSLAPIIRFRQRFL
jgi:hypothetical protein